MRRANVVGSLYCILILFIACRVWAEPLDALILSGQNNHDWRETTPVLRNILEQSGRFSVKVLERPETMTQESVSGFDVIISNWNAFDDEGVKEWPEAARTALINFVRYGKGFVSVHAGSSSFYDWDAYQQLVITSWKIGVTDHGPQHTFRVTPTAEEHPITQGVEPFDIFDELWHRAPLQPGARVLATAYSAKEKGGTGRNEPMLLVRDFGQGRSVNILLGHDVRAMKHPSFRLLFARSAEWAATREVTLPSHKTERSDDKENSRSQLGKEQKK